MNAPSIFQRYINHVLQGFLNDFISAYVDDVLIFTDGDQQKHRQHVKQVLKKLQEASLQLNINKYEFKVQSTKYLGFVIEAGKGLRMDPEKVKAIQEWAPPKSAKGVLSFIGFANFYRRFRDWLFVPETVAAVAVLGNQDRPVIHHRYDDLARLPGHCEVDHRSGCQHGNELRRRGRRDDGDR